jgi:hypothetical protein
MPKIEKISAKGQYGQFPGVTIVAKVSHQENPLWAQLYQLMMSHQQANEHYSALPHTALHMTACHLYTHNGAPQKNLHEFIKKNTGFFRALKKTLTQQGITPIVTIKSVEVTSRSIKLKLNLPKPIKNSIKLFAKEFNLQKKLPSAFHITLGYNYKKMGILDRMRLQYQLNKDLKNLVKRYGSVYELLPVNLHYFESMLSYHPWNGSGSPFTPASSFQINSASLSTIMLDESDTKDYVKYIPKVQAKKKLYESPWLTSISSDLSDKFVEGEPKRAKAQSSAFTR